MKSPKYRLLLGLWCMASVALAQKNPLYGFLDIIKAPIVQKLAKMDNTSAAAPFLYDEAQLGKNILGYDLAATAGQSSNTLFYHLTPQREYLVIDIQTSLLGGASSQIDAYQFGSATASQAANVSATVLPLQALKDLQKRTKSDFLQQNVLSLEARQSLGVALEYRLSPNPKQIQVWRTVVYDDADGLVNKSQEIGTLNFDGKRYVLVEKNK